MSVLFSKKNCSQCDIVKNLLSQLDIDFEISLCYNLGDVYRVISGDDDTCFSSFPILLDVDGTYLEYDDILIKYNEPLLTINNNIDTIFPIQHPDLWNAYEKAVASFWTVKEIDFHQDEADWKKMSDNEKYFIKHILAFFSSADGIVNTNLANNFSSEVQFSEARAFYSYQQFNETIHSETYSLLIDRYITDPDEKMYLFQAVHNIPSIQKKANWCRSYIDRNNCRSFAKRLIAFACVEGILFSGAFCSIFWLKKRGLMPGLCFSNELISRDEGSHLDFAVMLFNKLNFKPSVTDVHSIVTEAVNHEKEFIIDSIPCGLIGMNSTLMSSYVEYVADRFLQSIGYQPIWNSKNPFDFMENISVQGKTNFFEKKVGEYSLSNALSSDDNSFALDAEF
jgi:ribonucleoside-diphosphate reductase subunit M2